jgi:hypothetical protein
MSTYYGQWQAQGEDIANPGHCRTWGQETVPTKDEGLAWLGEVAGMCTASQRKRRQDKGFNAAERFVRRAPAEGYPTTSKHFYAGDDAYLDARVDLEIYVLAFRT